MREKLRLGLRAGGTNLLWQQPGGSGKAPRPGAVTLQPGPLAGTLAGGGDELDQAVGEDGGVEGVRVHAGGRRHRGGRLEDGASLIGGSWSGPVRLLRPADGPRNGAAGLDDVGSLRGGTGHQGGTRKVGAHRGGGCRFRCVTAGLAWRLAWMLACGAPLSRALTRSGLNPSMGRRPKSFGRGGGNRRRRSRRLEPPPHLAVALLQVCQVHVPVVKIIRGLEGLRAPLGVVSPLLRCQVRRRVPERGRLSGGG